MLLDRLRDSFSPEDARAEALCDRACSITASLHGVEGRATYTFHLTELEGDVQGKHDQNEYVVVSSKSPAPVVAAIHEMGHVLDAVFLNSIQVGANPSDPPWKYSTDMAEAAVGTPEEGETLLCDWLDSVRSSSHWLNLDRALSESTITTGQAEQIKKLLKVRELWARSYELFVALRCSEESVRERMNSERQECAQIGSSVVYNYWQAEDFNRIEMSIEQVFRRLGWLTK
jgi:hypothetical protein